MPLRRMSGNLGGRRLSGNGVGGIIPPQVPTHPPADWRAPATVTTSAGLSGSQSALQAAQATAASKSRPSLVVASGATEWIDYAVAGGAGDYLLSFVGQETIGTPTISKNGVSIGWTENATPPGGSIGATGDTASGRRQFARIACVDGDVIRLQIAAGAAARTIAPLLHKLPATGPWDAHVFFGASREAQGFWSQQTEAGIIAAFPGRDPLVFNYALSGQEIADLNTISDDLAAAFAGVASTCMLGSIIGNDVTADRPYASGQKAALDAQLATLLARITGAGMVPYFSNISWRNYTGLTPTAQTPGSLEYNDAVIHPFIAASVPVCWDASIARPRIDQYLRVLADRSLFGAGDQIHSSPEGYASIRAMYYDTAFRHFYTGSWGTSQIEQRVADAELRAGDASTATVALTALNEADYALIALVAGAPKTAFQARVDAARPNIRYKVALASVVAFEASKVQPDKDTANADVATLRALEGDSSRLVALQARIDAIVVNTILREWKINFGTNAAVSTWNSYNAPTVTGVFATDMTESDGSASGLDINAISVTNGNSTASTLTSTNADFPTAVLQTRINRTTTSNFDFTFQGDVDPTKVYDAIILMSTTTGSSRVCRARYNGVSLGEVEAAGNTGNVVQGLGLVPVSGTLPFRFERGTGNGSSVFLNAIILRERVA